MSPSRRPPTNKKQTRLVEASIKKIELRYAQGQDINKRCGPTAPRGLFAELASEYQLNGDTLRKLRAIASPETGYSRRELNQLFKVFRSEGRALTISHFVRLISMPKGKPRDELTLLAIKEGWSAHRLQSEILALEGRRRQGGRRPQVVAGKGFSAELSKTLWAWERWLDLHLQANRELEPDLEKKLKALKRLIGRVESLVSSQQRVGRK